MYDPAEAELKRIEDDPELLHQEVLRDLVAEKGADWVKEHASELEENWKAAKFIMFGLS